MVRACSRDLIPKNNREIAMQLTSVPEMLAGALLSKELESAAMQPWPMVRLVNALQPAGGMVSAVLAAGVLVPGAVYGAPGDLDPSFGDVGRVIPAYFGPVWSLEAQDDDLLYAGGGYYCYYYSYGCDHLGFSGRLLATGNADSAYAAAVLNDTTSPYRLTAKPLASAPRTETTQRC
jgi:hypothetical protein